MQELAQGVPSVQFVNGVAIDEVLTRTDGSGLRALLGDALGSTIGLTNASGSLVAQYTYEPFGSMSVSGEVSGNSTLFTGREADGTDLYYYRARYYDAARQRFISEDPLDLDAGNANLYTYVFNDPLNWTDPSGEGLLVLLAPAIAGAITGGAVDLGLQGLMNGGFSCLDYGSLGFAAALGSVGGGLGGLRRAGTEFSHWIPKRYFNPNSRSYKPWLPEWLNNPLNGSWITPGRHYKHDPFRYPRGWRKFGDKWDPWLQHLDRTPNWMKGGAAGGGAGEMAGRGSSW